MPDRRPELATPFPVLIADLGGTHARFALVSDAHAVEQGFAQVRTREHPDVEAAIQVGTEFILQQFGIAYHLPASDKAKLHKRIRERLFRDTEIELLVVCLRPAFC